MTTSNISTKDSGITWIGQIPEGWNVKRLKYIAKIETGYTPPKADKDNYSEDGIPRIKPDNLNELEYLTDSSERISEKGRERNAMIQKDDIMVCCIGSVGKMGVAGCELTFNQQINGVKFNSEISKGFGKFLILASQEEHLQSSQSVVLPILNKTKQSNISFPLPPLSTQTTIANYLDTKTAQITEFITKKKQLISLLQEQKQAIIHQAVTKGIDPSAKMKDSGIAWIGQIPDEWEARRLNNCCYVNLNKLKDNYENDFEIKYIEIENIEDGQIIKEPETILFSKSPSRARRICNKDDVIISTVRTYLKAIAQIKINEQNLICSTGFVVLSPNEDIVIADYLFYLVYNNYFIESVCKLSDGVSYPAINEPVLSKIMVPVPKKDDQKKIVSYIKSRTTAIEQAITKIEQEISLIEEYRTSLIYHAVTGKTHIN